MITIYWQEIRDKISISYFRFIIPTPYVTIGSMSKDHKSNKRNRSPLFRFIHPYIVKVIEIENIPKIEEFQSFTITEKEFVRWLGRISLDHIIELEDIKCLMKVKQMYEKKDKDIL